MARSNLAVRLITAGVVAPILVATMFLAPPVAWYAIVLVATLLGAHELFGMTHPKDSIARWIGVVTTGAVSASLYFFTRDPLVLVTIVMVVPAVGVLVPLWRLGDIESAAFRITAGVAGPFYVGGLLVTIALLRRDHGDQGGAWVLLTLMLAWLGDTGGYFFGRFLGRRKLYEAVSPKKTVEGFFGSIFGATFGAMLAHFWYLPTLPIAHGIALGVFGGALGQMGDLVESLLKRSTGIKDSGQIVPGHGGILDRVDALLIVGPIVYLYTRFTLG